MRKKVLAVLTLVCLLLSPFASSLPDGLETVLQREHLTGLIKELEWPIMADYSVSLVENSLLQGWMAGVIGVVIVAVMSLGMMTIVRRTQMFSKLK